MLTDRLERGSIWDEPNDWMMALRQKERILQAAWDEEEGSNLKNHVQQILLAAYVLGSDTSTGYLLLRYSFSNYGACENEIQASEAEVL